MDDVISRGCLSGRPFKGVGIFVKKSLATVIKLVKTEKRYIIVQVGQTVFINVYLPSTSTVCRDDEFVDCLASIVNDIADLHYVDTGIVFGGDMNVDLSVSGDLCYSLLHFALGLKFVYEKLPPDSKTFRVESTGVSSLIDHFAVSQSIRYDTIR